jgi:hypothetical protein
MRLIARMFRMPETEALLLGAHAHLSFRTWVWKIVFAFVGCVGKGPREAVDARNHRDPPR